MKGKKRILFIYTRMVGGGAERVLIDLLRNIDYNDYEIDLALVEKSGILLDQVPSQVNIIRLWKKNSIHYFMAVKLSLHLHSNQLFSQRLNSSILRKDYDVEIAFLEGLPTKLLALRRTSAKKYSWVHIDLDAFHNSKAFFYGPDEEIKAYGKTDKILTVSEDCKRGFIKCFPRLEKKTKVIYNPIDISRIQQKSTVIPEDIHILFDSNKFNVITVARLHSQKNPLRLLQTASLAKSRNLPIKFIWIGDGEMEEIVTKELMSMGLDDMIVFTGFRKNPYPYIKAADMLLLPSDAEGFGLVLCEAMALNVPVASTPTAGPQEIIGNNEYGLIIDFTPESIIDGIEAIRLDTRLREGLVARGKIRVQDFSVKRMVSEFEKLIE